MHVHEHLVGSVAVLTVYGDILLDVSGPSLADAVRRLLDCEHRQILLDIRHVRYVDSDGLGELVRCHSAAAHRGGVLRLCGVTARLREMLALTRLLPVFDCAESMAEGLAAFTAARRSDGRSRQH
jgi:anti-sigma B factor antagonist